MLKTLKNIVHNLGALLPDKETWDFETFCDSVSKRKRIQIFSDDILASIHNITKTNYSFHREGIGSAHHERKEEYYHNEKRYLIQMHGTTKHGRDVWYVEEQLPLKGPFNWCYPTIEKIVRMNQLEDHGFRNLELYDGVLLDSSERDVQKRLAKFDRSTEYLRAEARHLEQEREESPYQTLAFIKRGWPDRAIQYFPSIKARILGQQKAELANKTNGRMTLH